MPIRQFKPVTKSSRHRSVSDFSEITRSTPEKSLVEPLTNAQLGDRKLAALGQQRIEFGQ